MKWVKIHSPKTLKSLVEIVCFFGKAHRYDELLQQCLVFFEKFFSLALFVAEGRNGAKWSFGPSLMLISGRIYSGDPASGNECKNGRQILGEMSFLDSTVWARYNL